MKIDVLSQFILRTSVLSVFTGNLYFFCHFSRLINKHSISASSKEQGTGQCKKKESMWARAPIISVSTQGSMIILQRWKQDQSQECRRGEEPKGVKRNQRYTSHWLSDYFTKFSRVLKLEFVNGNCIQIYIISRDNAVLYALCYMWS